MNILETKIVTFTDTCFFIYKETIVIQPPTIVDNTNTLTTTYNPTTDIVIESRNIDELMIEFDRLGLTLIEDTTTPVEPIWHDKTMGVKLFMSYENNTKLMQNIYGLELLDYFKNIIPHAPTFNEPEGVYIYLNDLYLEHKTILESYGANIYYLTHELEEISNSSINNL